MNNKSKSVTGFKPVSPQVDFPKLERELLEKWHKEGIVEKYLHRNDSSNDAFSFLDGPITANNPMGVHHAWGRTYKDFWQRFWNMKGKKQRFQNGFDEQGLWVEVEVEKELGLHNKKDIENLVPGDKFKSLEKFINLCKERVVKYSGIQTEQSKRLGYFMDWENSYHTSSDENNYSIWNFIKVVNEKGWLYKGHDTVPWCPRCGTAISQHEILTEEYREIGHETIYFKLPIRGRDKEFLLAWTTTPWTIPSNVAVAVNPKFTYGVWEDEGTKERLIFLYSGLEQKQPVREGGLSLEAWVMKNSGKTLRNIGTILPKDLIGLEYAAPFDSLPLVKDSLGEYVHRVIDGGDIVTETEGTGLLHVAPSAGEEDFKLGKENKLPVIPTIEEDAAYVREMGDFAGVNAKKHPEEIINYLKSHEDGKFFFKTQRVMHRYPTCWRCKTELVWRLVDEWYIAMDKVDESGKTYREQMVEVAKKITWMPDWGLSRELDWLKNMHDWLISKKRYWGLALPIWHCEDCNKFEVIGSKDELKERAVEGWKEFEGNSPHRPWIDSIKIKCSKCESLISRIPDVGNPWLDAGIVPFSALPEGWRPADFITESFPGQFKNWFYALIAMSTALKNEVPTHRILGFGSVRNEKGEEMHKSKGNSMEFNEAADKAGVDVMRWLYLRTNPEQNVNFGYNVLDEIRRMFIIKLWNVYSFFVMYANLYGFQPSKDFNPENVLDKWILSRMNGSIKNITKSVEEYDAADAMGLVEIFIDDLSNWYVRRIRERVKENNEDAKNALNALWIALTTYAKVLAPFAPFIADEIFTNLVKDSESVHLEDWPMIEEKFMDEKLEKEMNQAREVVEAVHAERKESNIKVRQPLNLLRAITPILLREEIVLLIKDEVNVLDFENEQGSFEIVLDKNITDDLRKMGEARDIIRKIQAERKVLGTALDEKVNVSLEDWPKEFEEEIKRKALVNSISKGEFRVSRI